MKKSLILFFLVLSVVALSAEQNWKVASPNRENLIMVQQTVNDGKVTFSFELETKVVFQNGLNLALRAYNDGCAYRWESTLNREVIVTDEKMDLIFSKNYKTYFPKPNGIDFFSHHENRYKEKRLASLRKMELACVPVLVELDNDKVLMVSDINLQNYPSLWVKRKEFRKPYLKAIFPPFPKTEVLRGDRNYKVGRKETFIAKLPATLPEKPSWTSWKVFLMGEKANLFNPDLFYCLSEETTMEDTSWIKAGLTV